MRDDNELMQAVEAHIAYCEETSDVMGDAVALIAFAIACILFFFALHLGVV